MLSYSINKFKSWLSWNNTIHIAYISPAILIWWIIFGSTMIKLSKKHPQKTIKELFFGDFIKESKNVLMFVRDSLFFWKKIKDNNNIEIEQQQENIVRDIENNKRYYDTGASSITIYSNGDIKEQSNIVYDGIKCFFYHKKSNKTFIQKWHLGMILLDSKTYGEGNWIANIQHIEIKNKEDFTDEELVMLTCMITHNHMISPITLGCGHIFDKYSIIHNMFFSKMCPLCNYQIDHYEENEKVENLLKKCKFIYNENNIEKNISIDDIKKYYQYFFD